MKETFRQEAEDNGDFAGDDHEFLRANGRLLRDGRGGVMHTFTQAHSLLGFRSWGTGGRDR